MTLRLRSAPPLLRQAATSSFVRTGGPLAAPAEHSRQDPPTAAEAMIDRGEQNPNQSADSDAAPGVRVSASRTSPTWTLPSVPLGDHRHVVRPNKDSGGVRSSGPRSRWRTVSAVAVGRRVDENRSVAHLSSCGGHRVRAARVYALAALCGRSTRRATCSFDCWGRTNMLYAATAQPRRASRGRSDHVPRPIRTATDDPRHQLSLPRSLLDDADLLRIRDLDLVS